MKGLREEGHGESKGRVHTSRTITSPSHVAKRGIPLCTTYTEKRFTHRRFRFTESKKGKHMRVTCKGTSGVADRGKSLRWREEVAKGEKSRGKRERREYPLPAIPLAVRAEYAHRGSVPSPQLPCPARTASRLRS